MSLALSFSLSLSLSTRISAHSLDHSSRFPQPIFVSFFFLFLSFASSLSNAAFIHSSFSRRRRRILRAAMFHSTLQHSRHHRHRYHYHYRGDTFIWASIDWTMSGSMEQRWCRPIETKLGRLNRDLNSVQMSQVCFDRTSLCNGEQTSDRDVYVLLSFFLVDVSCIYVLFFLFSFFFFFSYTFLIRRSQRWSFIHAYYIHERNGTVCKIGNRIKSRKRIVYSPPGIIFSFLIFFQPVHLSTRNPDLSPSHSHESVALSYAVVVFVLTAEIEQSNSMHWLFIYSRLTILLQSRTQRFETELWKLLGRFPICPIFSSIYRSKESVISTSRRSWLESCVIVDKWFLSRKVLRTYCEIKRWLSRTNSSRSIHVAPHSISCYVYIYIYIYIYIHI